MNSQILEVAANGSAVTVGETAKGVYVGISNDRTTTRVSMSWDAAIALRNWLTVAIAQQVERIHTETGGESR